MMRRPQFSGGGRYRHPQAWIDHVIATDPALAHVRLTHPPRYSGRLRMWGQAILEEVDQPGYTSIGRASLSSRRELLDTIIHEEAHHRLWLKAQRGAARAWNKIMDLFVEEAYVREVAYRFVRLQEYIRRVRPKKRG